jgi:CBS domain-containing protein
LWADRPRHDHEVGIVLCRRADDLGPGGARGGGVVAMRVRDAMSTVVLTIGPEHTLREASRQMSARKVGAVAVHDPDGNGIGILTERDILHALGAGQDPDTERAGAHLTSELVFAAPEWTLEAAAEAMLRGGFRHLIVLDGGEVVGIVSVRDVVRAWSRAGTAVPTS